MTSQLDQQVRCSRDALLCSSEKDPQQTTQHGQHQNEDITPYMGLLHKKALQQFAMILPELPLIIVKRNFKDSATSDMLASLTHQQSHLPLLQDLQQ